MQQSKIMAKRPSSSSLRLPTTTELVGLEFELSLVEDTLLFPNYATGLHAWFLDQVRRQDPVLSQYLHDSQTEKPFTLSRLNGKIDPAGRRLQLYSQQTYRWCVSLFSKPTIKWLRTWLKQPPTHIHLKGATFAIERIAIAHPPTTYAQLLETPTQSKIALSFLSPTSFRSKGHHLPLPIPNNLFHSYLRRWNNFAPQAADQTEFLNWIDENVLILRHRLETAKVPAGKRGSVTGFLGAIELSLAPAAAENKTFQQLFFSLACFAPYCGTGHKTPFGLGQTRLGWLNPPSDTSNEADGSRIAPEDQLAQRIEQITTCLMQQQKRTGGTRATQVCQTRATILARRELGESLQDIAADLDMPYETVKTYAKLARRALKAELSPTTHKFNESWLDREKSSKISVVHLLLNHHVSHISHLHHYLGKVAG
jgi:CRISPR-associated endoribonuclease Cas6